MRALFACVTVTTRVPSDASWIVAESPVLTLLAALFSGCVTSAPLPGPGDGTSVFVHPITGEEMRFEMPVPRDLNQFIGRLRTKSGN